MKIRLNILSLKFFFVGALALGVFPSFVRTQTLVEKTFRLEAEAEVLLDLAASAPNTSWGIKGSEAAVVTVLTDGRYHQDVILFAGSETFNYAIVLGRLRSGGHSLRVEFNRKQSALKASVVNVQDAKVSIMYRSKDEYQAVAHSPILYARPNTIGRFSDIPLLMWYETKRDRQLTTILYSVIFSNEDGGTETNALMARWGRATDIEWVYEVKLDAQGRVVDAAFQGVGHRTLRFRGKREANHPLLLVASDNNNFSDAGRSEMRFALRPSFFDVSRHSREELMDRHPWTYRVMAEELQREGKIAEPNTIGQQIADPRFYLYLEAAAELRGTALSFAIKLKGDRKWYTSDLGIGYFKIDRSGYFRTAVRLPAGAAMDRIERIAVRCDFAGDLRSRADMNELPNAACALTAVNKVFLLDENFRPGPPLSLNVQPLKLGFGDMVELYDGCIASGTPSSMRREVEPTSVAQPLAAFDLFWRFSHD